VTTGDAPMPMESGHPGWPEAIALAAVTGATTGAFVAGFDLLVVDGMFAHIAELPVWVLAAAPMVGLALAALIVRYSGRVGTATSDAYIQEFHDPATPIEERTVPGRLLASLVTLGFGNPMGLEGPSMFAGAAIGSFLQRRFHRLFADADRRVLLVAGTAAGIAAIFKAPMTGVVFALEVPYRDGFERKMLLPTLVSAATSYLVFATINGTAPLFPIHGSPGFTVPDLLGAIGLGVIAGLGARGFSIMIRAAKRLAAGPRPVLRIVGAGITIGSVLLITYGITGRVLTVGIGYGTITWAVAHDRAVWILLLVLVLRAIATGASVAGGGVGGLFVPLVVSGALLGRAAAGIVPGLDENLSLVIGVAAFLGAGYRVPLAAVIFVAEATGRPGFIVPALLAAVAAELVMGNESVTSYQRSAEAPSAD
jgi:CIC family chloride channel protein